IGNKEAIANGKTMKLDAPPYLFKGRTMVPLRFVSEGLGLTVNYKNNRVDIQSPALKVNGKVFDAIQAQSWMTMGSIVSESKNNICIKRIYDILSTSKVKEIPADQIPFSGIHANLDIPNFYYLVIEYSFKSGDKTVEQYQIYSQLSFGMDTNTYAIKDTINSRWYTFTKAKYYNIVDLHTLGNWKTISNTVV
ncbi:MAG: copper amine oxidase N-terminal domain-containing protein, partial [Clostridiales bacterium]